MRRLQDFSGGRQFKNDDLIVIQEQLDRFSNIFNALEAFVITGLVVSPNGGNYDISEGLVFINGKTIHYPGETNRTLPVNSVIREAAETEELPRDYVLDANNRDGVIKSNITITNTSGTDGDQYIKIDTSGPLRRLEDAIKDNTLPIGSIQMYSGSVGNFNGSGAGTGKLKGFQLCNGSNGAPDLRGKFIAGLDERSSGQDTDFDAIGDAGGSKVHDHKFGDFTAASDKITLGEKDGNEVSISPQSEYDAGGSGVLNTIAADKDGDSTLDHASNYDLKTADGSSLPPYYTLAFIYWVGNGDAWGEYTGGGSQGSGTEQD